VCGNAGEGDTEVELELEGLGRRKRSAGFVESGEVEDGECACVCRGGEVYVDRGCARVYWLAPVPALTPAPGAV
jgi:hypothetical protein